MAYNHLHTKSRQGIPYLLYESFLYLLWDYINGLVTQDRIGSPENFPAIIRYKITYPLFCFYPVIFLDTKRSSLLYNNLKGRIVDISQRDSAILFTLDIDTILTERQCRNESFEFVDVTDFGTRIRLEVIANDDESVAEEERIKTIIPFQIAYAVSIHKAQGLEYDSVKIVITNETEERITHNIFYTAITRAKNKLKLYWSPETEQSVLGRLEVKNSNKDAYLLAQLSALTML